MSKLGDAIRRNQRVEAAPMGFGAARPAQRPSMLVGFIGPADDVAAAKTAGADFIVVESAGNAPDSKALRADAGDLPLAVAAKIENLEAAKALQESGVDALLAWDDTPAPALLSDDLGYILVLSSTPSEDYLRGLELLNLEAVILEKVPAPLTLTRQMEVARIAALGRKPLLCLVPGTVTGEELQCLRSAGAVAVLTAAAHVGSIKAAVAALPAKKPRREERAVVSLPRRAPAADDAEEDE